MAKHSNKLGWTKKALETAQAEWKAKLDVIGIASGSRQRSKSILEFLKEVENDLGSKTFIDVYVLCMSGLEMQSNQKLYNEGIVTGFCNRIEKLLALISNENIRRGTLSFVVADYHRLRSKILYRDGLNCASRWQLCLASRFTGTSHLDKERAAWDRLGIIIRLERLGHFSEALSLTGTLLRESIPNSVQIQAKWKKMMLLSYLGQTKLAVDVAEELRNAALSKILRSQLEWQVTIIEIDNEIPDLYRIYQTNNLAPSNLVDLTLRYYAFGFKKGISKLPNLKLLRQKADFDHKALGVYFEAAELLQSVEDNSIPINLRLDMISPVLEKIDQFPNFEAEILFFAGLYKLLRNKNLSQLVNELEFNYLKRISKDPALMLPDYLGREWTHRKATLRSQSTL